MCSDLKRVAGRISTGSWKKGVKQIDLAMTGYDWPVAGQNELGYKGEPCVIASQFSASMIQQAPFERILSARKCTKNVREKIAYHVQYGKFRRIANPWADDYRAASCSHLTKLTSLVAHRVATAKLSFFMLGSLVSLFFPQQLGSLFLSDKLVSSGEFALFILGSIWHFVLAPVHSKPLHLARFSLLGAHLFCSFKPWAVAHTLGLSQNETTRN